HVGAWASGGAGRTSARTRLRRGRAGARRARGASAAAPAHGRAEARRGGEEGYRRPRGRGGERRCGANGGGNATAPGPCGRAPRSCRKRRGARARPGAGEKWRRRWRPAPTWARGREAVRGERRRERRREHEEQRRVERDVRGRDLLIR